MKQGFGQTKFFEYGFRDYDAQLGRWHVRDPMAETYASQSPYHFAGNNPVGNREVNGAVYQSLERQDWERGVNESGVLRGSSSLDNAIGQADAYDAAVYDYSANRTYLPGVGSVSKNDVVNLDNSQDGLINPIESLRNLESGTVTMGWVNGKLVSVSVDWGPGDGWYLVVENGNLKLRNYDDGKAPLNSIPADFQSCRNLVKIFGTALLTKEGGVSFKDWQPKYGIRWTLSFGQGESQEVISYEPGGDIGRLLDAILGGITISSFPKAAGGFKSIGEAIDFIGDAFGMGGNLAPELNLLGGNNTAIAGQAKTLERLNWDNTVRTRMKADGRLPDTMYKYYSDTIHIWIKRSAYGYTPLRKK